MRKKIVVFIIISVLFILFFPMARKCIVEYSINNCCFVLETTGKKNSESNGYEVWIDGIIVDGKDVDLSTIELDEGWGANGRIYSNGDTKYSLKVNLGYKESVQIRFIKHPYSGVVDVITENKNQTIDLFSETEMTEIYTIE